MSQLGREPDDFNHFWYEALLESTVLEQVGGNASPEHGRLIIMCERRHDQDVSGIGRFINISRGEEDLILVEGFPTVGNAQRLGLKSYGNLRSWENPQKYLADYENFAQFAQVCREFSEAEVILDSSTDLAWATAEYDRWIEVIEAAGQAKELTARARDEPFATAVEQAMALTGGKVYAVTGCGHLTPQTLSRFLPYQYAIFSPELLGSPTDEELAAYADTFDTLGAAALRRIMSGNK